MSTVEDTGYMLLSAAAEQLGMSRWAVWKAVQRGRLNAKRVGRDYFVHQDELARFQRERRPPGRPPARPD